VVLDGPQAVHAERLRRFERFTHEPVGLLHVARLLGGTVSEVARLLARAMGREEIGPEVTGQARLGDIRHCIADIGKIQRELGYAPRRDFAEGLAELAAWVAEQQAVDRVAEARRELEARGLVA
jgi:dTDP-L-rhamnose 4-epimerase